MFLGQRPSGMLCGGVAGLCLALLTSWRPAEAKPPPLPYGQLQAVPGCFCSARECCDEKHHKSDTFRRAFVNSSSNETSGTRVGEEVWKPACSLLNFLSGEAGARHRERAGTGYLDDLCGERRLRKYRHADLCSYLYDEDGGEFLDWGQQERFGNKTPTVGLIVEPGICDVLSVSGALCWETQENQTWMAQWLQIGRGVDEKGTCPSSTFFDTKNGSSLGIGMHCVHNSTTRGMRVTTKWLHPTDETMRTQPACNLAGDFDEVIREDDWWGSYLQGPKFMCIDIPKGPNGAEYRALIYAVGDPPCEEAITTTPEPKREEEEEEAEASDVDEAEDKDLLVDGKSIHDLIMEAVNEVGHEVETIATDVPAAHHIQTRQQVEAEQKRLAQEANNTLAMTTTNETNSTNSSSSVARRWQQILQRKQEERQSAALEAEKARR